jgi:hypothetical protein
MATINDLSPGNKLSLKGKLFELQKKLTLLDLEKKISEEYPFQPTFYHAQTHARAPAPASKAYEPSLSSQSDAEANEFTYQPKVNSHRKVKMSEEQKLPVHIRLYEKAKVYKAHIEQLSEDIYTKDDSGRLLFQPRINKGSNHYSGADENESQNSNNMPVQDYLYRDALVSRLMRWRK